MPWYCRYYKEELSEDVKLALAGALAAWLPRCSGMPEAALARITGERCGLGQGVGCKPCRAVLVGLCGRSGG